MSTELYTERSEQTARTRAARVRMTHERRPTECSKHTTRTRVARARTTLAPEGNTNFSWFKLQHIILSLHHSRSERAKQVHSLHLYNPMYIDSA